MSIPIDDFTKVDIRIGTVVAAELVEGSEKLLKLQVDFGAANKHLEESATLPVVEPHIDEQPAVSTHKNHSSKIAEPISSDSKKVPMDGSGNAIGTRQILSGIAKYYSPDDLIGKQFPFIVNLAPRKMMGLESQGMILATSAEDGSIALLSPNKTVRPGERIR